MDGNPICKDCKSDCSSCNFFYSQCVSLNQSYFGDEFSNLNQPLGNYVVAFACLGLWNGVKSGYKVLGKNLNTIFQVSADSNTYYYDRYNVRATCVHHDGTNEILFRKLKDGIDKTWFENYMYQNNYELDSNQLSRYTDSLVPYVKSIYGV